MAPVRDQGGALPESQAAQRSKEKEFVPGPQNMAGQSAEKLATAQLDPPEGGPTIGVGVSDGEREVMMGLATAITCPSNMAVIVSDQTVTIHQCNNLNLHMNTIPGAVPCSGNSSCRVELHQAQGILCEDHDGPLKDYLLEIATALSIKLIRQEGAWGFCKLCPSVRLMLPDVLEHIKGHGSLLGKFVKHPETINKALDNITPENSNSGEELPASHKYANRVKLCSICLQDSATAYNLVIHKAWEHTEQYQQQYICDFCEHPLYNSDYDKHFELYHSHVCCGTLLKTAGEMFVHANRRHTSWLQENINRFNFYALNNQKNQNQVLGKSTFMLSGRHLFPAYVEGLRTTGFPEPHSPGFEMYLKPGRFNEPLQVTASS